MPAGGSATEHLSAFRRKGTAYTVDVLIGGPFAQFSKQPLEFLPNPSGFSKRHEFPELLLGEVGDEIRGIMGSEVRKDGLRKLQDLEYAGYSGMVLPGDPRDRPGRFEALPVHDPLVELRPGDRSDTAQVSLVAFPGPLVDRSVGKILGLGGQLQDPMPAVMAREGFCADGKRPSARI
jgi:hypothetical protein